MNVDSAYRTRPGPSRGLEGKRQRAQRENCREQQHDRHAAKGQQKLRFAAGAHARLPEREASIGAIAADAEERRVRRQQGTKRALLAARSALAAPIFSGIHDQRVKFVEQLRLRAESKFRISARTLS